MIRMFDNYSIDVSDKCYVVSKVAKRIDKKSGEEIEYTVALGYYSTLMNAIKGMRSYLQINLLKEYDGEIRGAIEMLEKLDERFFLKVGKSMRERGFLVEKRTCSISEMAKQCKCSFGLLRMLEEDDKSITHPNIAARIAKEYGLNLDEYNSLVYADYRGDSIPIAKNPPNEYNWCDIYWRACK